MVHDEIQTPIRHLFLSKDRSTQNIRLTFVFYLFV